MYTSEYVSKLGDWNHLETTINPNQSHKSPPQIHNIFLPLPVPRLLEVTGLTLLSTAPALPRPGAPLGAEALSTLMQFPKAIATDCESRAALGPGFVTYSAWSASLEAKMSRVLSSPVRERLYASHSSGVESMRCWERALRRWRSWDEGRGEGGGGGGRLRMPTMVWEERPCQAPGLGSLWVI